MAAATDGSPLTFASSDWLKDGRLFVEFGSMADFPVTDASVPT